MMANVTVTNRRVVSRGRWRQEIGDFTEPAAGSEFQLVTKLSNVLFFQVQGLNNSDNDAIVTYNSTATLGAENDGGTMDLIGLSSGGTYTYRAIGR